MSSEISCFLDSQATLYAFASHFASTRGTISFPQKPVEEVIVENPVTTPEETSVTPVNPTPIKPVPAHLSTAGIAQGYYVIGGVLCRERNAKRFIKQLNHGEKLLLR